MGAVANSIAAINAAVLSAGCDASVWRVNSKTIANARANLAT